jgi:hypothetical protein
MKLTALTAIMLMATPFTAQAHDLASTLPLVVGDNATVVYVFPTSPQTFVPVSGLPSFLVAPGAPPPQFATEVIYAMPQPAVTLPASAGPTVDCSDFTGEVAIAGPDTFGFDRDGDGLGCEPEDR